MKTQTIRLYTSHETLLTSLTMHVTLCGQTKWNEINECFRATFVYQAHEVGGREAHKIVGVELLFYLPNFVFPPRPTPQFCGGDSPRFGSTTMVGCPPKGTSMDVLQQMKFEHKIMFNWTPRSASRQKDVSHQTRRHVNKRNSVMSVMLKKCVISIWRFLGGVRMKEYSLYEYMMYGLMFALYICWYVYYKCSPYFEEIHVWL